MNKILTIKELPKLIRQLHKENKHIVLAGGCFDILHIGHLRFLQKAKEKGDILMVYIESDERIKRDKGHNRPVHKQLERAEIIANLIPVDYVLILPFFKSDQDYDNLAKMIKPAIIAATKNDSQSVHKEREAKLIDAKLAYVTPHVPDKSSTHLLTLLQNEK